MSILRSQVILRTADNIPANFVTNTFYWESLADIQVTIPLYTAAVKVMYDDLNPYFSTALSRTGHEVRTYLEDQPSPNYPVDTTVWDLASNLAGTPLPSEVSVTSSFEADKVNGLSQASRRGRVYFGPLNTAAMTNGRVNAATQTDFAQATVDYILNVMAIDSGQTYPVVWSRKLQSAARITTGWVDDAFDTQRRRGIEPSSRVTWDLGGLN